jgi:hypothetical protein
LRGVPRRPSKPSLNDPQSGAWFRDLRSSKTGRDAPPIAPDPLFAELFFCRLSKTDTRAATVLVNELDAGQFEGSPHNIKCRATRLAPFLFELVDSHDSDACAISQVLLAPAK